MNLRISSFEPTECFRRHIHPNRLYKTPLPLANKADEDDRPSTWDEVPAAVEAYCKFYGTPYFHMYVWEDGKPEDFVTFDIAIKQVTTYTATCTLPIPTYQPSSTTSTTAPETSSK